MVLVNISKKFFQRDSNGHGQEEVPVQRRPCQHQRNTSFNLEIELTSATENTLSPSDVPGIQKHSERYAWDDVSSCHICKDEQKAVKTYRWKIMAGLFFPFLTQTPDATIIAGALTFIASDFNQLGQLNWIISAFNLTAATFIPFWGQFADVFGRYAAIQSALLAMLLETTLCAAAPNTAFPMLLAGRGFQGVGCAGLLIITKIILADKFSLEENAKNNNAFTIVGGAGYGIGPTLGGYLTRISWRWCFIINIPLGVAGLVLVHFVLRPELLGPSLVRHVDGGPDSDVPQTFTARLSSFDFGGQFLFLFGMGLFVLAITWAGSYYPWGDIKVLMPLAIGVTLIIAFLVWEYLMLPGNVLSNRLPTQKAMIPFKLLGTRNAEFLLYINLCTGMAMYVVYYFVELYFVLVKNYSAGKAGTSLIYYTPGLGAGAFLAMLMCNRWPRQTFFPLFIGTIIEPLGITILAIAIKTNNLNLIFGMLALTGVGTGIRFMPGTLHGVGYFPTQIPQIVSLMSLAVSLGGTLATTIMLNVFNNSISKDGLSLNSATSASLTALSSLPADELDFFRRSSESGIVLAFFAITAFLWLGVVASTLLGNMRIGKEGEGSSVTEKGSFFWGVFLTGRARESWGWI